MYARKLIVAKTCRPNRTSIRGGRRNQLRTTTVEMSVLNTLEHWGEKSHYDIQ